MLDIIISIPNKTSSFSDYIVPIASILNILLVIFVYFSSRKFDVKRHNLSLSSYWYKDILLPKCISTLETFEDDIIKLFDSKPSFDIFYKELSIIQKSFVNSYDIFKSLEKDLYDEFYDIYLSYEDEIIESFYEGQRYSSHSFRNKFMLLLLKHDKKIHSL